MLEGGNESSADGIAVGDICFSTGWTEPKNKSKGMIKLKEKAEGVLVSDRKEYQGSKNNREVRKGCWTRLNSRSVGAEDQVMSEVDVGSKRKKKVMGNKEESELHGKDKKLKFEEETKILGSIFAIHLGAAKVAKQPRRAQ